MLLEGEQGQEEDKGSKVDKGRGEERCYCEVEQLARGEQEEPEESQRRARGEPEERRGEPEERRGEERRGEERGEGRSGQVRSSALGKGNRRKLGAQYFRETESCCLELSVHKNKEAYFYFYYFRVSSAVLVRLFWNTQDCFQILVRSRSTSNKPLRN